MAEYQKFITTIDSFETLSQDIIKNCEDFTQTAMEIGSKIGDVVGKGAGKAVSYVDDSDIKGSATKVGLSIFSTVAKDLFTAGFGAVGVEVLAGSLTNVSSDIERSLPASYRRFHSGLSEPSGYILASVTDPPLLIGLYPNENIFPLSGSFSKEFTICSLFASCSE